MACVQAQWQPKLKQGGNGNKGAGIMGPPGGPMMPAPLLPLPPCLSLGCHWVSRQRCQPGFGTQPDLSCEPHEINCCGLLNSSPCLEEDTCTILYLYGDDQNIKVWVCESWFGFVRVYLGIPHQFQVHSLS